MLVTYDESLPPNFRRGVILARMDHPHIPLSIEANFAKCAFHNCANFETDRSFVPIHCYVPFVNRFSLLFIEHALYARRNPEDTKDDTSQFSCDSKLDITCNAIVEWKSSSKRGDTARGKLQPNIKSNRKSTS